MNSDYLLKCLGSLYGAYGPSIEKSAALQYFDSLSSSERATQALTPAFVKIAASQGKNPWVYAVEVAQKFDNIQKLASVSPISGNPAQFYVDWASQVEKNASIRTAKGLVSAGKAMWRASAPVKGKLPGVSRKMTKAFRAGKKGVKTPVARASRSTAKAAPARAEVTRNFRRPRAAPAQVAPAQAEATQVIQRAPAATAQARPEAISRATSYGTGAAPSRTGAGVNASLAPTGGTRSASGKVIKDYRPPVTSGTSSATYAPPRYADPGGLTHSRMLDDVGQATAAAAPQGPGMGSTILGGLGLLGTGALVAPAIMGSGAPQPQPPRYY